MLLPLPLHGDKVKFLVPTLGKEIENCGCSIKQKQSKWKTTVIVNYKDGTKDTQKFPKEHKKSDDAFKECMSWLALHNHIVRSVSPEKP